MDLHTLKLVAVATIIALVFGAWLVLFLTAEGPGQFLLSLVTYVGMLGLFTSGYLLVGLFDDFTVRDIGIITVLAVALCIVSYALARIVAAGRSGGDYLR